MLGGKKAKREKPPPRNRRITSDKELVVRSRASRFSHLLRAVSSHPRGSSFGGLSMRLWISQFFPFAVVSLHSKQRLRFPPPKTLPKVHTHDPPSGKSCKRGKGKEAEARQHRCSFFSAFLSAHAFDAAFLIKSSPHLQKKKLLSHNNAHKLGGCLFFLFLAQRQTERDCFSNPQALSALRLARPPGRRTTLPLVVFFSPSRGGHGRLGGKKKLGTHGQTHT